MIRHVACINNAADQDPADGKKPNKKPEFLLPTSEGGESGDGTERHQIEEIEGDLVEAVFGATEYHPDAYWRADE